jgi:TolA-binding protein
MFMRTNLITICVCSLFMGTAAIALSPSDDLLAGPSMADEEVTDQDMQLRRLQETGKKSNINARQQMKYWMSALESIELTQDQQTSIKALVEELQRKQREFQKTYGAELTKIRKEQRKANNAAFAAQAAKEAENANVLMKLAPDPTSYQERAWVLLTPDQQHNFQTKYQAIIAEEAKRREARQANDRSDTDVMMKRDTDRKSDTDETTRRRDDRYERQDNVDTDSMLRRIKFLQRLQRLKEE